MDHIDKLSSAKKDKSKKSRCCSVLKDVFEDYCSSTSIHGIGYIGAKDKNLYEKIWWIIVFILSVIMCAILISRTWNKWVTSPVIVSFDTEQTPIWQIPFPAVTICPINKIRQGDYNYSENFNNRFNLTGKKRKLFWDLSLICNLEIYNFDLHGADETTNEEAFQSIIDYAPNDFVQAVMWQYDFVLGSEFFVPVLTKEGLCFTFNSLSQNDMFTDKVNHNISFIQHNISNRGWTMENGYLEGLKLDAYPRRTALDGFTSGLALSLATLLKDINYLCGVPIGGYKLILHNPAELPRAEQQYILIPFDRHVAISLQPELMTTSNDLLSVDPKIRNCYFSHEKSLMFFKIYTQNNCKLECLSNITKVVCGCTSFHLPRDENTTICGYGNSLCMDKVQKLLLKFQIIEKQHLEIDKLLQHEYDIYEKCDCLPSCSYLQYSPETSQTSLHYSQAILSADELRTLDDDSVQQIVNGEVKISRIDIFFKETHFLAMHRSELYGQTDFVANCGGLLGLFMGFSLLSILEIIYFMTIRLYCKIRNRKKSNNHTEKTKL